ncbi:hypothetical protein KIKIMORA_01730 [Brevundimonas phage vB_BpoS-Kikimora]|uniref:Uncharacterized protein n=2 Tax=Kikimoravirus TaxID=3425051 RepID=A0A9E7N1L4_9CAUD|nr:hypothetical protein KIKIMORA_01730 [Brevundimonas phage vB_BpoS-Kikimora]UTC28211.1 hypothetical protein GURKE_01800 [Brevundimonas phage vB_BpoS-Gurke]
MRTLFKILTILKDCVLFLMIVAVFMGGTAHWTLRFTGYGSSEFDHAVRGAVVLFGSILGAWVAFVTVWGRPWRKGHQA